MSEPEWEEVSGPTGGGNGTFTDRLKVPGGWLYKVEEWGEGGMHGRLENSCLMFVPEPRKVKP